MSKKMVRKLSESIYLDDIDIGSLADFVNELIEKHGRDAVVKGDDDQIYVSYEALETDYEYEKRIDREESAQRVRRKQYEQLKKEFGE